MSNFHFVVSKCFLFLHTCRYHFRCQNKLYLHVLQKESSHSIEVHAKPEYHKFLIGRGGANIRKVREKTGARVVFPASGDTDQDCIVIMGKKEEVEQAKTELEVLIQNLVNTCNS